MAAHGSALALVKAVHAGGVCARETRHGVCGCGAAFLCVAGLTTKPPQRVLRGSVTAACKAPSLGSRAAGGGLSGTDWSGRTAAIRQRGQRGVRLHVDRTRQLCGMYTESSVGEGQ